MFIIKFRKVPELFSIVKFVRKNCLISSFQVRAHFAQYNLRHFPSRIQSHLKALDPQRSTYILYTVKVLLPTANISAAAVNFSWTSIGRLIGSAAEFQNVLRLSSDFRKQFKDLNSRPVYAGTMSAFRHSLANATRISLLQRVKLLQTTFI